MVTPTTIPIDRNQLRQALAPSDGCGDVGWLNCATGEIVFLHVDADRFEEWYGLAAANQMMKDRNRIAADASNWTEIPKYPDGDDDAVQRFLDENEIRATWRTTTLLGLDATDEEIQKALDALYNKSPDNTN
jgi:hypothetical protein